MLVKLLPDQISQYWQTISHAIEVAAPPTVQCSPNRMNNILQSLLGGGMQCWIACERVGDLDGRVWAVVVTTITEDHCSGIRNLLIYAIYSYGDTLLPKTMWLEGLETLRKFAKSLNCHKIVAYTDAERIVDIVCNVLGGEASQRLITIPI